MILLRETTLFLGLLLRGHGTVNSPPRKHQWHQVKGTVGGSISLLLDLKPGEMEDKSQLDFQPQRGEGLELAVFMGGQWKRSQSPDRFGQRLELVNETTVRITGLEMEDSGVFKASVKLSLARIWYQTFNLTVYALPPVKVTQKTLLCLAYSFYPKEIDITWRKDGEVMHEDTFCGVGSPNADGTYYTWCRIEVDPKVRSRYQCHMEHDGLQEPLGITTEESVPVWVMAVGVSVGLVLVLMVVAGLVLFCRNYRVRIPQPTAPETPLLKACNTSELD